MQRLISPRSSAWVRIGLRVSVAAIFGACAVARAAEPSADQIMPYARQNAVVKKQCGSCHSDALTYGGLSLEHFDAAYADPSLAAMLVSKITNGLHRMT